MRVEHVTKFLRHRCRSRTKHFGDAAFFKPLLKILVSDGKIRADRERDRESPAIPPAAGVGEEPVAAALSASAPVLGSDQNSYLSTLLLHVTKSRQSHAVRKLLFSDRLDLTALIEKLPAMDFPRIGSALVAFLLFQTACSDKSHSQDGKVSAPKAQSRADITDRQTTAPTIIAGNNPADWQVFIPKNSPPPVIRISSEAVTTPSGRVALGMRPSTSTRYGITPKSAPISVTPGQRYRLSAFIRAEFANAGNNSDASSTVLRATLWGDKGEFGGGHYFVGIKGTLLESTPARFGTDPTPAIWSKLESVVEIPKSVNKLRFVIFSRGNGIIYIDEPKVELVPINTPLSPLL